MSKSKEEIHIESIYNQYIHDIETQLNDKDTTFTNQLNKMGQKLFGNQYVGTFASNQIPDLKNDDMCIVNLDSTDEPGSHWVALYQKNDIIYIYDSFGRQTYKILPNIYKLHKVVHMSDNDAEQKHHEFNCGQRSLAWLLVVKNHGVHNALLI
jgi:hypothetical protein